MAHESPLPQCQMVHDDFAQHKKESVPIRDDVSKHCSQILTLEKAHEATMADIKAIREEMKGLRIDVEKGILGIRLWILGGVLAIAVTFAIPVLNLMSSAGELKEKVNRLEKLHPYGSPISPVYGGRTT